MKVVQKVRRIFIATIAQERCAVVTEIERELNDGWLVKLMILDDTPKEHESVLVIFERDA